MSEVTAESIRATRLEQRRITIDYFKAKGLEVFEELPITSCMSKTKSKTDNKNLLYCVFCIWDGGYYQDGGATAMFTAGYLVRNMGKLYAHDAKRWKNRHPGVPYVDGLIIVSLEP